MFLVIIRIPQPFKFNMLKPLMNTRNNAEYSPNYLALQLLSKCQQKNMFTRDIQNQEEHQENLIILTQNNLTAMSGDIYMIYLNTWSYLIFDLNLL